MINRFIATQAATTFLQVKKTSFCITFCFHIDMANITTAMLTINAMHFLKRQRHCFQHGLPYFVRIRRYCMLGIPVSNADEPRHIFSHQQRSPFTLNFHRFTKNDLRHDDTGPFQFFNYRNLTDNRWSAERITYGMKQMMRHALYIQLFAVALDALHPAHTITAIVRLFNPVALCCPPVIKFVVLC